MAKTNTMLQSNYHPIKINELEKPEKKKARGYKNFFLQKLI